MESHKRKTKMSEDGQKVDYYEKYLRTLADYQNLLRRYDEDKERIYVNSVRNIMIEFLHVLNDIEIALNHVEDKGIANIYKKIIKVMEDNGLEEIKIQIGEADFDPNFHEAIEHSNGDKNKITKVYRKGYLLQNNLIQSSLVAVGNGDK